MKKRILAIILCVVLILQLISINGIDVNANSINSDNEITDISNYGIPDVDYVDGEVIACIKYDNSEVSTYGATLDNISPKTAFSFEEIMDVSESNQDLSVQNYENSNNDTNNETQGKKLVKVTGASTEELIASLLEDPMVEFVEPNYKLQMDGYSQPSDPGYQYQWGLNNETADGVDINITNTWDEMNDNAPVVVIMDSGIDYNHIDFQGVMWNEGLNYSELVEMGGGAYGYNTTNKNKSDDIMDTIIGHGTHCAGIVASQWNNNEGVAGTSPNAKIMGVKIFDDGGLGNLINALYGYAYIEKAKKAGVNIVAVNNSWGSGTYNGAMMQSINTAAYAAGEAGILSFFAAGNTGSDNDLNTGNVLTNKYIIYVGANDSMGNAATFSCYGKRTVDVFAPGTAILSTVSTDISIVPMDRHTMPVQYLPQIQDASDSFFYEDFENGISDVTMKLYDKDGNPVSNINQEIVSPGYISDSCSEISLAGIDSGDAFYIEITLPKDALSGVISENELFMAFQGTFNGIVPMNSNEIYVKADNSWKILDSVTAGIPIRIRCTDSAWNQSSGKIKSTQDLLDSKDENGNIVLRIKSIMQESGSTAYFKIDDLGFGKKASDYYYADGTSMATPMVTGVAAVLSGKYSDIEELSARIRGGVNRETASTGIGEKSISGGFIDVGKAVENPVPVLDTLTYENGKAVLNGYFFGDGTGSVTVAGMPVNIYSWTAENITFEMPDGMSGTPEIDVVRADGQWGRQFFSIAPEYSRYTDLNVPNFSYGMNESGYELTSDDMFTLAMAGANDTIIRIGYINELGQIPRAEIYNVTSGVWQKLELPELEQGVDLSNIKLVAAKSKYYMYYNSPKKNEILIYDTESGEWNRTTTNISSWSSFGIYKNMFLCIDGTGDDAENINIINPRNGEIIDVLTQIPEKRIQPLLYASGDTLIVTGGTVEDPETGNAVGSSDIFVYDGEEWTKIEDDFFSNVEENHYFDSKQTLNYGTGAVDGGLIVQGPVKDLGKDNMVDTWHFDVDTKSWSADTQNIYSTRKTMNNFGISLNNKFYVMARQDDTKNRFVFRSIDISYTDPTDNPKEPEDPVVSNYATKNQLMNNYNLNDENSIGLVKFGKKDDGTAQNWYIAGKDSAIAGDNVVLFSSDKLFGIIGYSSDFTQENQKYSEEWGCTYPTGTKIEEVNITHYGCSNLRNKLSVLSKDVSLFNESEQNLMNTTTIISEDQLNDTTFTTSDKLYAAAVDASDADYMMLGTNNNIKVTLKNLKIGSFWTRTPAIEEDGFKCVHYVSDDKHNKSLVAFYPITAIQAAFNLNMENVYFASNAPSATAEISGDLKNEMTDGAFILRYSSSGNENAEINANKTEIKVNNAVAGMYVIVQNDNGACAVDVSTTNTIKVSDITISEQKIASLDNCKVWIESTNADGMTFAKTATQQKEDPTQPTTATPTQPTTVTPAQPTTMAPTQHTSTTNASTSESTTKASGAASDVDTGDWSPIIPITVLMIAAVLTLLCAIKKREE